MPELWDIFCRVIDNFGDIGVCWRLSSQLARRGHRVRLWVDDPSALGWMAPGHRAHAPQLQVLPWEDADQHAAGDVVIEAFGCEIDPEFIARSIDFTRADGQFASKKAPIWLNLEYLSAERFAEACHGLPSPVMSGPCAGMTKWFFYPGFTPQSGGLLREDDLAQRLQAVQRTDVLAKHRLGPMREGEALVTLFCYEPQGLSTWLSAMAQGTAFKGLQRTRLLVAPGRPAQAVKKALASMPASAFFDEIAQLPILNGHSLLHISYLRHCPQDEFDQLLAVSDFNCVRGEDSLVRALLAGRPVLWHIYPQADGAHIPKLAAWLGATQADADVRQVHAAWNSDQAQSMLPIDLATWRVWAETASEALWAQSGLLDRLDAFVRAKQQPSENPQFGQKTE